MIIDSDTAPASEGRRCALPPRAAIASSCGRHGPRKLAGHVLHDPSSRDAKTHNEITSKRSAKAVVR